jgi:hypothetical protein
MAQGKAFFISPKGVVSPVATSHIATVIADPRLFGMTRTEVEAIYEAQGEPVGLEAHAREQILVRLLKKRWIRIREHPNRHWAIEFGSATPETLALIHKWARSVLRRGIVADRHVPVLLIGLTDGFEEQLKLSGLAARARTTVSVATRLSWVG